MTRSECARPSACSCGESSSVLPTAVTVTVAGPEPSFDFTPTVKVPVVAALKSRFVSGSYLAPLTRDAMSWLSSVAPGGSR